MATTPRTASTQARNAALKSLREATQVQPVDAERLHPAGPATRTPHWVYSLPAADGPAPAPPRDDLVAWASMDRALDSRQSALSPGMVPGIVVANLMYLLSHDRDHRLDDAGRRWSSRAFPAAGGCHSIEPLLHVSSATGWDPGWYVQTGPTLSDVNRVHVDAATILLAATQQALRTTALPSAVIFAISEPERVLGRYPNGISLLWRDAGSLLGAAQLAVTGQGATSTPLGLCVELDPHDPYVAENAGRPLLSSGAHVPLPPFAVGALALGGPADVTLTHGEHHD